MERGQGRKGEEERSKEEKGKIGNENDGWEDKKEKGKMKRKGKVEIKVMKGKVRR